MQSEAKLGRCCTRTYEQPLFVDGFFFGGLAVRFVVFVLLSLVWFVLVVCVLYVLYRRFCWFRSVWFVLLGSVRLLALHIFVFRTCFLLLLCHVR